MKPIAFLGDSLDRIRAFPDTARHEAGYQLERVQRGLEPDNWKPMKTIEKGVREIRIGNASGAYRVIYIATFSGSRLRTARFCEENPTDRGSRPESRGDAPQGAEAENTMTNGRRFDSVWDAIETSPSDAANMKARADLMIALRESIDSWGVTQAEAARRLEVTQPRLNDLIRGRITKFSLDALVELATRAGLAVRIQVVRPAA